MTKSDQFYIDKVLNGEDNKYSVLIDRYKDLIFTLCYRIIKDKENAEEAAQDTFIKAYKSLSKFKGESKFSSWIYRIAYNTSLDKLKHLKRQIQTVNNIDINELNNNNIEQALDILESNELKDQIKNSIKKLNSEDAFILTLYYYEDLSMQEIAKITGHKANSIKVRIHRSRQKLMLILQNQLPKEILDTYGNK
ncbi:MAG: RNA polymerase sigma factor [Bacteroidales bacterium]|nr:RNA polymerase sigma factor [Bacteroidales bacterium]